MLRVIHLSRCVTLAALVVLLLAWMPRGWLRAETVLTDHNLHDRSVLNATSSPWNAIAKIQTEIGSRCTGALITLTTVVTAAHCLYNRLTGAFLRASSVHVLLGFQGGYYMWHGRAARYTIGAGFVELGKELQSTDWASIELSNPVSLGIAPLPTATTRVAPGMKVMLAGYNRDRGQLLTADKKCRIKQLAPGKDGMLLLSHDCRAIQGSSGGPLLTLENGHWSVIGINIGMLPAAGVAVTVKRHANDPRPRFARPVAPSVP